MAGVACGLSDHMEDDFPQIVKPPVTEEVGPPGRCRVEGRGDDDGIGQIYLLPVFVKDVLGPSIRSKLPRIASSRQFVDIGGEMVYQPEA